ncbi:MerR family transcriptional regulator [Photobacterium damselae]
MTEINQTEKRYAIGEVSEITGVNSVTLRAWQRRYGLIVPQRTPKGHRLYTHDDIVKIRQIVSWLKKGVSIGKVKPLLETQGQVREQATTEFHHELIDSMMAEVEKLDSHKLSKILLENMKIYPFDMLVNQVLMPIHCRIADTNNPLKGIQSAFWQGVITQCCNEVMVKAVKPKAPRCLLLSFEQSELIWIKALLLTYQGYAVTTLVSISDKLTGFQDALTALPWKACVVVGENKLTTPQLQELIAVNQAFAFPMILAGSLRVIHANDFKTSEL